MKKIIFLFLLIANHLIFAQNRFKGRVINIKDGDTFKVLYHSKEYSIRLAHIDAPEKKQPFGNKAKLYVSELCLGKEVLINQVGKRDRYGRIIAEVFIKDKNINQELIRQGLAWHFKKYSKNEKYAELEQEARKNKIGIWSNKNPIAPWNWRKRNKTNSIMRIF